MWFRMTIQWCTSKPHVLHTLKKKYHLTLPTPLSHSPKIMREKSGKGKMEKREERDKLSLSLSPHIWETHVMRLSCVVFYHVKDNILFFTKIPIIQPPTVIRFHQLTGFSVLDRSSSIDEAHSSIDFSSSTSSFSESQHSSQTRKLPPLDSLLHLL